MSLPGAAFTVSEMSYSPALRDARGLSLDWKTVATPGLAQRLSDPRAAVRDR